jgi:hypothetical protein
MEGGTTNQWTRGGNSYFLIQLACISSACRWLVSAHVISIVGRLRLTYQFDLMKYFLAFTIIILTLLISACSFSTPFVVINSSEGQLEVYYELKPSGMMPNENIRKPLVATVQEFNSGDFQ